MAKSATAAGSKARLEARASRKKLLYIFAGSLSFALIGLSFMLGQGGFSFVLGAAVTVFFGYTGFVAVRKLLTEKGVILSIGPEGIRDTRLLPDTIPWSAVKSASATSFRGQHFIVLQLEPEFEAKLPTERKDKPANSEGKSGLSLAASGLDTSFNELKAAVSAYRNVQ